MSNAYQPFVLEKKSQPYVTIATHLSLYTYTRQPFGVAAVPLTIFQQIMYKMLDELCQTGGILDDLIITVENDAQHSQNLNRTPKKLDDSHPSVPSCNPK